MSEPALSYEYDAARQPVQGLASAQDAGVLGPGWLKEAQNVTYADDGVLRSALGTTQVADAGSLPAGTVYGLTREPVQWGQYRVALCALAPDSAPTTVDIYYRKYDTSADTWDASWTKCTADSGKYGDTKGQVPSYGAVQFQPVSDSDGVVGCLVQFGVRDENVLLVNFSQSFLAIPVLAIQPPDWADASTAEAGMSAWMSVAAGTMKTSWSTNGIANVHYNTGGTFDVAGDGELNLSTAGGNGREWRLIAGSGATYGPAANDFGWFQLNAGVDFSGGRQVVMLFAATSSESYFSNFQIALTTQVESGTTDGATANKLTDSTQNFLTTVTVGDFVINTTDNAYTTVTAIDSDTVLSLAADVVGTAKAYVIVRKCVIHDPAATVPINERKEIPVDSTASVRMAVFPIPADADVDSVDGVMFTVTDTTNIPTNATFRIMWVACGGKVPGTAQYALAFYSSTSKTDSPGVLLRDVLASENASTLIGVNTDREPGPEYFISVRAGVAGGSVPPEFYMPINREVYYRYRVPVFAPVSETVNGVSSASSGWADKCSIYRKDPNEGAFYHVEDVTVAGYSGSWLTDNTLFSGTDKWKKKAYRNDTVGIGDKNFKRKAPDAFNEPVPVGQATMLSGKRLFVGAFRGAGSATTAQMGVIKVSESDQPFRFREFQREANSQTDVDSGYAIALGPEDIRAFFDVSASNIGSPATYCITDKRLIQTVGAQPIGIGSVGCTAPGTVTEKDGRTFFLDSECRVRLMDAVTTEVSQGWVHDALDAIPAARRQHAQAISFRDRVFFACSETGQTANLRLPTWSWNLSRGSEPGGWEQNGKYPATACPQFFMLWNVDGASKVYFMATDRKLYELDAGADHAGTSIAVAWRFGDRKPKNPGASKTVERAGMVFDAAASLTATVTKTGNQDTAKTQAGTIAMGVSTAQGKKYETGSTQEIPVVEDSSVKVRYTCTKTSSTGRMAVRTIALLESETENDDFGA